jgi:hypothetical protein
LKERYGQNEPPSALHVHQYAFESSEGAGINPNLASDFQIRAREIGYARSNQPANGLDFLFVDRNGNVVIADNLCDAGRLKDWQTVVRIKSAKQISGEQRGVHFLNAIRPSATAFVKR